MTYAYSDIYLEDAMDTLGSAMEYATLLCHMEGQEFLELFVASGIAEEFGRGNVTYISGMSGVELANLVFRKCGMQPGDVVELPYIDYPAEYWTGWILAYYQWYSGKSYETISRLLSYQRILDMYGVLHEADPSRAVVEFNRIMEYERETNLARLRKCKGLSQSQLAKLSNISVRSIQLYEQKQTDINKAQYNHLKAIARALGCKVEDLLE